MGAEPSPPIPASPRESRSPTASTASRPPRATACWTGKAVSGSTSLTITGSATQDELERIIGYIEANPVKAGLAEAPDRWRFSSAWHRTQTGTEWGLPLAPLA